MRLARGFLLAVFCLAAASWYFAIAYFGSKYDDLEESVSESTLQSDSGTLSAVSGVAGGIPLQHSGDIRVETLWSERAPVVHALDIADWPTDLAVAHVGVLLDADSDEPVRLLGRTGSIGEPMNADDDFADESRQWGLVRSIGEPIDADDDSAVRVITGRTGMIGEPMDVESMFE